MSRSEIELTTVSQSRFFAASTALRYHFSASDERTVKATQVNALDISETVKKKKKSTNVAVVKDIRSRVLLKYRFTKRAVSHARDNFECDER